MYVCERGTWARRREEGRRECVRYVRGNAVSLLLSMVGRKEGGDTLNRVLYSMLCRRVCVVVEREGTRK